MEIFNKLTKKASETYKYTAEKTSKLAKEAKLKMKINENKSDIDDLYKEIGKKVYEKHVREENINIKEELEEECTKIDVLSAEIETTLKECLKLKDRKQCTNCYAEIEKTAQYCPNCGAKQEDEDNNETVKEEIVEENIKEEEKGEPKDIIAVEAEVVSEENLDKNQNKENKED